MKKDIEWLKEKVKGEYEYDRAKHNKEDEGYVHREFMFKYVLGLLDQLDEPEVLPVIPKYVADWVVRYREKYDLYPALRLLENNTLVWGEIYKWYRMNTHKFVNAYLTGEYEVEKEPLYYALIKGHEFPSGLLSLHDGYLTKMSKEDWNVFGVNDSNADFVRVDD